MELTPVESSNIDSIGYDSDLKELVVKFKHAATYSYSGVEPNIFRELMSAESKGKFFSQNVKGIYEYRKV